MCPEVTKFTTEKFKTKNEICQAKVQIGCVHQSCAAGTSLGEELMELSSSVAGDFILGWPRTFENCHKLNYEWAVVTKTVHQLKFLQFSKLI